MHRRSFLHLGLGAVGIAACGGLRTVADAGEGAKGQAPPTAATRDDAVTLSAADWKTHLTDGEFRILREAGTERAFTGDLWDHTDDGVYTCAGCALPLFDSATKFKSGTGWPSFTQPIAPDRVTDKVDATYGMIRTENLCARCGGHLGHVFRDGPRPTGLRYCINSASLDFVPRKKAKKIPTPPPVQLGGYDAEGA